MSGLLSSSTGCLSLTPGIQREIVSAMQDADQTVAMPENMPFQE